MIGVREEFELQLISKHDARKGVEHLLAIGLARRLPGEDSQNSDAIGDGVAVALLQITMKA
jgi:hypothetical protein